jgi:hypothetical protein
MEFERIEDNKYRCTTCEAILPSGIFGISNHWANCSGKQKMKQIIKTRL